MWSKANYYGFADNAAGMTSPDRMHRYLPAALVLLAVAMALVLACGCTGQSTGVPTTTAAVQPAATTAAAAAATTIAEGKKMVTFTEKDNGATEDIAKGTRFMVQLNENPTTGYQWNATTSAGLTVLSSEYQENAHAEGMVGVGGVHTWIIQAAGDGNQTFSAVYKRSWEATTGNETAYQLGIRIVTV